MLIFNLFLIVVFIVFICMCVLALRCAIFLDVSIMLIVRYKYYFPPKQINVLLLVKYTGIK